jgi:hypothetical protein
MPSIVTPFFSSRWSTKSLRVSSVAMIFLRFVVGSTFASAPSLARKRTIWLLALMRASILSRSSTGSSFFSLSRG